MPRGNWDGEGWFGLGLHCPTFAPHPSPGFFSRRFLRTEDFAFCKFVGDIDNAGLVYRMVYWFVARVFYRVF
ncbi:hypothetical protein Cenrod_1053 [Candidatus Symbiobacter mobilis CR]|uniref:Uncharacterized protein n=1 Tax=Candidatus Symbiobacter mobilis CR TaxID=946483 RepID=U5N6Y8_9BURK|nr:hypothetical protein Cenrod_1053 [Candidatus Symbiobacter mobilis CR]